ncbi:AtpZ/AtpI family protein [Mucilaginibacter corticis]|uniref:AtpZ/AtpI family protein n=1 Tax=Mucilaginibacter corticis TaxID=2597670 RepID=A0A556MFI7_9SPHI|nr:AtpZ/AtpI family protein [Mucilaginibacter corticis]TSJ38677.1 AtpZ/AtpI family protein [Mucilaginibacter corticis]
MAENEPNNGDSSKDAVTNYAKFVGVAFQMLAIIGVFTYVGYKIDQSAGHATKWVTAVLSVAGVFISLFIVIRSIKN